MSSTKNITIIGAGWLGIPLAITLLQKNNHVIATKQTFKGLHEISQIFQNAGISNDNFQLIPFSNEVLEKKALTPQQLQVLFQDRQIIITIPPTPFIKHDKAEMTEKGIADYGAFIHKIAELAEKNGATEIIYTSSTSVYGNSSGIIHEELPAMPQTYSAKAIINAEKALKHCSIPITILRLAGLIGHGRHPIFSLQGRDNIRSPFNAINLLHIHDLITAITVILNRQKSPQDYQIYNLVTPYHPNRQSYYQTIAKLHNLSMPSFEVAKPELKRIVDGGKITETGDFCYQEIDLLHAPLEKIFS